VRAEQHQEPQNSLDPRRPEFPWHRTEANSCGLSSSPVVAQGTWQERHVIETQSRNHGL